MVQDGFYFLLMKGSILLLFVLFGWSLSAQNLVPNPGFDDLVDCPFAPSQIFFAEPWVSATNGTPDLFNECSNGNFMQVPYAGRFIDSYQIQRSGMGYAYIVVYSNANSFLGNSEYLEAPLKESMQKGISYYLEFYVSPDFTPINNDGFTDAIGMALSDTFYYKELNPMEALPLNPIIENRGMVIKDTIGWTRVSGYYKAKGGEKYVIVGNFRNANETLVEFVNPSWPFANYFYIEDVLIMPFDPLPDTLLLCDGIPEELNAGFLDATYMWNTGETDSIITISQSGQYIVEAFMENCTLRDTIVVLDTRETENFPSDTVICRDEPLRLSPPLPGEYQWSDGSPGSETTISSSGNYSVSVTNDCGEFIFSTEVVAEDCACNIYVPNAFSPNEDGINDFLEVYIGCDFDYQMRRFGVFNQWGGQVYSTTEGEEVKWNGTSRGKPLPAGVYVWFLEYDVIRNGISERKIEKGDVTILR